MNKKYILYCILFLILVYGILAYYFSGIKTSTIYGDDLMCFQDHFTIRSFTGQINSLGNTHKFRPVYLIVVNAIIDLFGKNVYKYYFFNVGLQALNTLLFAITLNLFLNSKLLSAFISLLIGSSRFAYYNITQVMYGGSLEALAMTFFLLSLYFILKVMLNKEPSGKQNFKNILWALLFSNLAIYTHERYITLFIFIAIIVLFYPLKSRINYRQKTILCSLAFLSIGVNIGIKKYIFGFSFFVGTAGQDIKISFSQVFGFLKDGLLSIIQMNSGPGGTIGMSYTGLDTFYKVLLVVIIGSLLMIFILFFISAVKLIKLKNENGAAYINLVFYLTILFILCIMPAVVTIRLEQRWLQASFSIFILIVALAFKNIDTKHNAIKAVCFSLFAFLFLISDHHYLATANKIVFIKYAEWMASEYKEAMFRGAIHPNTENIFIYDQQQNSEHECTINWILADGYNFEFYQGKRKNIIYLDSMMFTDKGELNYLMNFNKDRDQVVSFQTYVTDITDQILEEKEKFLNGNVEGLKKE